RSIVAMIVIAFGLVLGSPSANAQSQKEKDVEAARKHFEEGSAAFSLGEFTRAIDEYRAAYKLKRDPVFLYNIAQAYRLAGDLSQALFFYKSYLSNLSRAPNRDEVEDRIRTLDAQLKAQTKIQTTPPNGTVPPGSVAPAPAPAAPPAPSPAATPPAPAVESG